ncbi:PadR family transcriptional regulator [Solicola sp. PLA-1-18]|uniref:PadR family transcriptional regulator n=1 Tax=Solicola sp. PLA-1-18 TaxID=3380532 RepID=UPI003B771311
MRGIHHHPRRARGFGPGFGPGGPGFGPMGPGFGPPDGRGRGRRGGRGRARGDVRNAVLALLAQEPMHGYQIIQEVKERTGGVWSPSPGSVYPILAQLGDEGLVRTEKAEGRSVVHLTDDGTAYVEEHRDELDAVWESVDGAGNDGFRELRGAIPELAGAAMQVAQVGRPEQVTEAIAILKDARRRIYLLLADDGSTDTTTT